MEKLECAVCLQTCIHPVQLPCQHIFCFLCVKGAANRSKRCALCRQEIPADYFNKPLLLEDLNPDCLQFDEGYQWFYEGRNGWWQYDERTSVELEQNHKSNKKTFELLVAGFLYVIDLENMIQCRRNDPTRKRRIKRDLIASTTRKGVAGLKVNKANVDEDSNSSPNGFTNINNNNSSILQEPQGENDNLLSHNITRPDVSLETRELTDIVSSLSNQVEELSLQNNLNSH